MDPHIVVSVILVLCLALTVAVYVLGFEVGKATALHLQPGYEAARAPSAGAGHI